MAKRLRSVDDLPRRADAQHPIPFPEPVSGDEDKHPVVEETGEEYLAHGFPDEGEEWPEDSAISDPENSPLGLKDEWPGHTDGSQIETNPPESGLSPRQRQKSSYVPGDSVIP